MQPSDAPEPEETVPIKKTGSSEVKAAVDGDKSKVCIHSYSYAQPCRRLLPSIPLRLLLLILLSCSQLALMGHSAAISRIAAFIGMRASDSMIGLQTRKRGSAATTRTARHGIGEQRPVVRLQGNHALSWSSTGARQPGTRNNTWARMQNT